MVPDDDQSNSDGVTGDDPDGIDIAKADETGKVAFDSYDKSVKLARNRGEKLRAAEAEKTRLATELARYQNAERLAEEERAKKAGDWDALAKQKDQLIAELQGKLADSDGKWTNAMRFAAIERALTVKIPKRFFPIVDVSRIEVSSDGKINETSLAKYANELKTEYPEILGEKKKGPGDEPPGPDGGGLISYEAWSKMPYAEQKKIPLSRVEGHPAAAKT
jgi:hypothetical protein